MLINNFSPLSKYVFKQLVKYALCVNIVTDVIWSQSMTQSHNDTDVDLNVFKCYIRAVPKNQNLHLVSSLRED